MVKSWGWGGVVGGPCDYCVTPVPIGLGFGFRTALGLGFGLRGPDLGLGLTITNVNLTLSTTKFCHSRMRGRPKRRSLKINCFLLHSIDTELETESLSEIIVS